MEWTEEIARRWPHLVNGKFDKKTMKRFRDGVKTGFVFASFYGSTASNIAKAYNVEDRGMIELHEAFWDKYAGIRQWQNRRRKFYAQHGYVACMKGRRRRAPIDPTKVLNSEIQGSASDIAVDAMDRLFALSIEKDDPTYQAVIDLHDDLEFDVPEKHVDEYVCTIVDAMLAFADDPLCVVPISVETAVGKTWGDMVEYGTFYSHDLKGG